jgi:branched-chain amino acid transport system ATP-binding protein
MSDVVLQTVGLKKRFGALVVAKDIDFQLETGSRHALIGPNGAGKTTFVGLLSGVIQPDAGRITLMGGDVTAARPETRVKRGLVRTFQVNNLFRGLTVLENVFLAVSERRQASGVMLTPAGRRRDLLEEADRIIDQLDLGEDRHRKISELAYGRQRMVEIALALSLQPKVLLLDEPAAGISSSEATRLLDTIDRLPADIAILMIEHDMQVVRRFASVVTVLVGGAVLMTGPPHEVMNSDEVRAVYLGQAGYARFATPHDSAGRSHA